MKHQAPLPLDFEKIIAEQSPNGDFATNALDVATNLGHQAKQASQEAYASMTEKYWPVIERVCREEIGPSALDAFRENKNISVLAKVIYSMLPFPFRILLNEDYFVDICLANRNRLLTLVEDIPDHKSADGGTKPE